MAIVVGGIVGIALPLLDKLLSLKAPRVRPWIPSAMGLGLAFVVPFANSLAFFVGAVIAELWTRLNKRTAERFVVPLASGAVAGESLAAAAYAILANLGVFGH